MKPEEIAFKDLPNAVSVEEFEAVLTLCKNQYKKVKEIVDRREQFLEETHNKFAAAESQIDDDKIKSGMQKLVDALVKRADEELVKMAKDEVEGIQDITEFINRFTPCGEEYSDLNMSFLNNYLKKD
jgi:hypothetical protein